MMVFIIAGLIILLGLTYFGVIHKPLPTVTTPIETPTATTTQYLHDEEVVIIPSEDTSGVAELVPVEKVLFEYVAVTDSCGPHFEDECLNVRNAPSLEAPVVAQLRTGVVLKVGGKVEHDERTWYKIVFDEWLRYPERLKGDWYVAAEFVEILQDEGDTTLAVDGVATTSKHIIVDRSEQKLYAYEDDELFMETSISTGLELTPTPRGNFTFFRKTPSRYMQGPLPYLADKQYYDLPGVPWNLYFTEQGAVIHGAYWHNSFGKQYSHGCVNMLPSEARQLYNWAVLGTKVTVQD
jgi:hypothetical protein